MRRAIMMLIPAAMFLAIGSTHVAAQSTFEVNVDRPGLDYRNFDLARSRPRLCQEECLDDRRCRAWTFVRPGFQGPEPRCWLKFDVPASTPSECCVSGVAR